MNILHKYLKKIIKWIVLKVISWKRSGRSESINVSIKALNGKYFNIGSSVIINSRSKIGNYVLINDGARIENASIGNFCSIASGVNIGSYNHNYKTITTHRFAFEKFYGFEVKKEKIQYKECIIGDDVWIGLNAIILPGVEIKRGSIVGAGAVVTKNIGEFEIWAGNPARYIKKRFDDEKIKFLKEFRWENFGEDRIQKMIDYNLELDKIKNANI